MGPCLVNNIKRGMPYGGRTKIHLSKVPKIELIKIDVSIWTGYLTALQAWVRILTHFFLTCFAIKPYSISSSGI